MADNNEYFENRPVTMNEHNNPLCPDKEIPAKINFHIKSGLS